MSLPLSITPRRPPDVAARLRKGVRVVTDPGEGDVVTVTRPPCRESGWAPVEKVLAVSRPGEPLHRTLPPAAESVSVAGVQPAFAPAGPPRTRPRVRTGAGTRVTGSAWSPDGTWVGAGPVGAAIVVLVP